MDSEREGIHGHNPNGVDLNQIVRSLKVSYMTTPLSSLASSYGAGRRKRGYLVHDYLFIEYAPQKYLKIDKYGRCGEREAGIFWSLGVTLLDKDGTTRVENDLDVSRLNWTLQTVLEILENQNPKYHILANNCWEHAYTTMAQLWIMVISVSPDNEGLIRTLGSFAQYARSGRRITLFVRFLLAIVNPLPPRCVPMPFSWRRALGFQTKFNSVAFTHIVIPEAVSATIYDQTRGDRKPDDVTSQRVRFLKIYLAVEFEPTEDPFYMFNRIMAHGIFVLNPPLLRMIKNLKRRFRHELLIEYAPGQCLKAGIKRRSVGDSKPEIRIHLLDKDDIRVQGARWMDGAGLPEQLNIESLNWTLMDLLNVLLTYQPGYYGVERRSLEYGFGVMQQLWIALSLLEDQCVKATLKYLQLRSSSYDFNLYKSPRELVRQLDMKRLMSKPGASSPAPLPQDGPEAHFSDLHAGQDAIV